MGKNNKTLELEGFGISNMNFCRKYNLQKSLLASLPWLPPWQKHGWSVKIRG
jgi:hypothetical protein